MVELLMDLIPNLYSELNAVLDALDVLTHGALHKKSEYHPTAVGGSFRSFLQ
jgi:hypothetical protein